MPQVYSNRTMVNGLNVGSAILPIQLISSPVAPNGLQTMFDNCSQNTFLCEKSAKKYQLKGDHVSYILVTTDGEKKNMTGTLYDLELIDRYSNTHQIQTIGI